MLKYKLPEPDDEEQPDSTGNDTVNHPDPP